MSKNADQLDEIWKEYEKQLKAQREYEKNSIEIHPHPEFVLKAKLSAPIMADDGTVSVPPNTKIFINFCSSEHIPLPSLDKDPRTQQDRLRVPLSCDHLGPTTDNKGEQCLVVDVVLSPSSIKLCNGNITLTALSDEEMELITLLGVGSLADFREFCAQTAIQNIMMKYKLQIDQEYAFLKNLRYKGDGKPKPQRIRRTQPLPAKSVLETLSDVQDEEEDDAYVKPANKKPSSTQTSSSPSASTQSSGKVSSAKVELIDEAPVRRLPYRFACVCEEEELTLAKYLQTHINIKEGKSIPSSGLPTPPSHFLIRISEVQGVNTADISVKTNSEAVLIDFTKHNDRISSETSETQSQKSGKNNTPKSQPLAYENMRFTLPFSIHPPHVSVSLSPATHTLVVTAPVRGWSTTWRQVDAEVRGDGDVEQGKAKDEKEVANLVEKMRKYEEEMESFYKWKNAWREKEKFGKKLLFRDSEEKVAEEDEDVAFVDVCSVLKLENPFLNAVYLWYVDFS